MDIGLKVDISLKRIIAYVIDVVFVTMLVTLITRIPFINPYYEEYNKYYEEYNKIVESDNKDAIDENLYQKEMIDINYKLAKCNIINGSISIICMILYFGVFQFFNSGQTIGKKIMKIKIDSNNDKKLNVGNYLIRSIILNNIILRILILTAVFYLSSKTYYLFSTVIALLESLIEIIILFMVILKKDSRGLHDIIAGTKVIPVNKKENK